MELILDDYCKHIFIIFLLQIEMGACVGGKSKEEAYVDQQGSRVTDGKLQPPPLLP